MPKLATIYHGTTTYRLPKIKASGGLRMPGWNRPDAAVYFATRAEEACAWARQRCVSDNMPVEESPRCRPVFLTLRVPESIVTRDCLASDHCRIVVGSGGSVPLKYVKEIKRCPR